MADIDKKGVEKTDILNYVDSLRHNNTVYTENEARNLIKYLTAFKNNVPTDSLRHYTSEGLLNYTWYLMNHGEWFLCGELLEKALRYCPSEATSLRHQIETAVAGMYLYDKDYKEAGKLLLKANKYFMEHRDTVEWLKNCVNLGLYYSRIHNRSKALEYYVKVLSIAQKEKKYENYYSIVSGYAERVEEDSVIGLSTLEKALHISLDNGYTFLLASNYNELARYYYRMENYHEALANARKALNYAERFSQVDMQVTACGLLADIYYIQKNYVAAYGMLSRKITIKDKAQEDRGREYYAHINTIDSLINWVDANVPLPDSGRAVTKSQNTSDFTVIWLWIALGGIIIAIIVGVIILRRKKRDNPSKLLEEENCSNEDKITDTDKSPDCVTHNDELSALQLQQASALNMVAESFNPMLDRIRNMVKEIPKTGDTMVDSQIRSLLNYLLQARLPKSDNTMVKAVKEVEAKFTERLSSTYPSLTKNDLRIAVYIRCGLNLQEISVLSGLQAKSVNQARYRLRKSLGLAQEDSLEEFITTF
ncbi:MAG: tetratricopeptide repeat protein [Muribaculaceae bacterium]|nr:tetratricopeptide repeat protein [Muribaculaceae bacterium]